MEPARRWSTYEDLLRVTVPDRRVPELIDGEITYKASPRAKHALAQGELKVELRRDGSGPTAGWWILTEPDVVFSEHTVVRPDLAGWRRSRLPTLPDGGIALPPDWVCEVLSPGHEAHDRRTKRGLYAREGVGSLWLVSPEARTLEAFELRGDLWLLLGTWSDGRVRIPPFEGPIEVGALFVPEDAPPRVQEPPAASYG